VFRIPQRAKTTAPRPLPRSYEGHVRHTVYTSLTATWSMVAKLVESLLKERQFHLYLDNLFIYWRLCQYLKLRDITLTGTY
jgi:hypothetical protein